MAESGGDWCTIESDPGVFTCLIESFGVRNVEFSELCSLDDESLVALNKVYGLIFLFKWGATSTTAPVREEEDTPEDLFFAKQVTNNACATQAILSVLLNSVELADLGETLTTFKAFTASFPPELRGEAIAASDEIRTAHNSFARKELLFADGTPKRAATQDDDVFHFIAYVPHTDGNVYELDGLQSGPILIGPTKDSPWWTLARSAIQDRIEKYAASEIKFNLMAVIRDRRIDIQSQLNNSSTGEDETLLQHQLQTELQAEEEKRQQWNIENERRRHNYLPFCLELIRAVAKSGKLPELTQRAKDRTAQIRRNAFLAKLLAKKG